MPTIKQKKAIALLAETHGNVAEAMRQAGYAPSVVDHPDVLTKSKAFIELFNEALPDDQIAAKHKAFLNSKREEIGVKALDMAYKLKGSYAPDKSINLNVELAVDNDAIEQLAQTLEVHERTNQSGDGATANAVGEEIPNQN